MAGDGAVKPPLKGVEPPATHRFKEVRKALALARREWDPVPGKRLLKRLDRKERKKPHDAYTHGVPAPKTRQRENPPERRYARRYGPKTHETRTSMTTKKKAGQADERRSAEWPAEQPISPLSGTAQRSLFRNHAQRAPNRRTAC
jgi:hypothetical protein